MSRWLAALLAVVFAAAAGVGGGYFLWGRRAERLRQAETRLRGVESEVATLQAAKRDLEGRVQQLTKEEERLAAENELLRRDQTTQQLQSEPAGPGTPRPSPTLPPK